MNRPSPLSIDNILRFLQTREDGATFSELKRGLHLRNSEQRPLAKMLANLKKRKAIVERAGGPLVLASQRQNQHDSGRGGQKPQHASGKAGGGNSLSGRLILHQDGYSFVGPHSSSAQ